MFTVSALLRFYLNCDTVLAPLTVGQRAYVMARCASVCVSIRACVNFFYKHLLSETTHLILKEFHRNVPAMVVFRIFFKEFDSFKNSGCHGNKT